MENEIVPFNKILRQATRDIHSVSDALVNAKLAFAFSDKDVWAEGLLVFYEIFRFLEKAMKDNNDTNLSKMFIEGMERTTAFEDDLKYYLGEDWKKTYIIRESVGKYLAHLEELEKNNPDLLIAYVYHLYMGLLSGGQILRKKRQLTQRLLRTRQDYDGIGDAVTDFGGINMRELKQQIVNNLNSIADSLDEETKTKIINESRTVFELNNEIINSIHGADYILIKKLLIVSIFALLLFIFWKRM